MAAAIPISAQPPNLTKEYIHLGSRVISIEANGNGGGRGPIAGFDVWPATASLGPSQPLLFTAVVSGSTNTGVIWTISPSNLGQISSGGLYVAPASFTPGQTVVVIATSAGDPSKVST